MNKRLSLLMGSALWATAALGVAVTLGVWFAWGGGRVLDFLSEFAAPTLSLCVVVLIVALALRRWWAAGGLVVAVGALILALQPQWFPDRLAPRPGTPPVRIYFANIWNENQDIPRAARSVAQAQPDVAAMVEFADQHRAAQAVLFPTLPYRVLSPGNPHYNGAPGAVIASRWPVTALVQATTWHFNVLSARIAAPSGSFRLVVTHLTRPWPFRSPRDQADQIRLLMTVLEQDPAAEPTVVVGDFNATTSGEKLKTLMTSERLKPAPAVFGDWPSALPGPFRIAIENAFSSPGLTILDRRIAEPTGSDHRPIVFTVAASAKR